MKVGKISANILKRSVLRQIHRRREEVVNGAGMGEDCAVFSFSGDTLTVSCVQEAALAVSATAAEGSDDARKAVLFGPEGSDDVRKAVLLGPEGSDDARKAVLPKPEESDSAGRTYPAEQRTMSRLIQKCANNLVARGAEPTAVLITLLLPEDLEEPDLKELMAEAERTCDRLHMQIAGGQTRVTSAVTVPYGVVTGIGSIPEKGYKSLKAPAPGQDVVISKWIGLEGTACLAKLHRGKLLERYPSWLVEEAAGFDRFLSVIPEAATAVKSGVCAMHDVSEGGIFGALWELAEGAGVGLTIDLKKLPLRQETVEVCEYCNVNPYELLSGGCLLMTSEDGATLVSALEAEGIPAVAVGKVTDSKDRILINEEEIRYMDRPKRDGIYGI